MYSPIENQEAEDFVRGHWTPDCMESEAAFRDKTERFSSAVYECYAFDSTHAAAFLYRCLKVACELFREEPFLSILEHHLAASGGILANWHLCEHDLDKALNIVEETWAVLDGKDSRRDSLGLSPALSTFARISLLNTLANVKWRFPDAALADKVLTPTQQVQAWLVFRQRVTAWLLVHGSDPEIRRQEFHRILWAGCSVARSAQRYASELVPDIVAAFNEWHEEFFGTFGLATEPDHWQSSGDALPTTPWYWHFEITKRWLAELSQPTSSAMAIADIEALHHRLLSIARNWDWARINTTYLGEIIRDRNWMLAELRARDLGLALVPREAS